ncbi:MAG: hypothetical protein H6625_06250 [Bdellovibrionaceae bacterium]|nr:hypothetical protein [Pseudobdellovibrionaceae bacterium]
MSFIKFVFIFSLAFSFADIQAQEDVFLVKGIYLKGLSKTRPYVVYNQILFKEGQRTNANAIEKSLRNIRNLNLFHNVKVETENYEDGKNVYFLLNEKWTTIPIFKLSEGGGVRQITLGIYDANLSGRNWELGTQYEGLGETDSGVLWFKDPDFFTNSWGIEVQAWSVSRIRIKYDQKSEEPKIINGFLHHRKKYYLGVSKQLQESVFLRSSLEYNQDNFSDQNLSEEVRQALLLKGLPPNTETVFYHLGIDFGELNLKEEQIKGRKITLDFRKAFVQTQNVSDFIDSHFKFLYYKIINTKWNYAQRLFTGTTSTNVLQYWNYLGGLESIRGFSDNRFAGRYFWLLNSEIRYSFLKSSNYILQLNSFLDLTSVAENFSGLDSFSGSSLGFGGRLILPKVYRFVLRIDYAVPLKKEDDMNLSFGVQQFF